MSTDKKQKPSKIYLLGYEAGTKKLKEAQTLAASIIAKGGEAPELERTNLANLWEKAFSLNAVQKIYRYHLKTSPATMPKSDLI